MSEETGKFMVGAALSAQWMDDDTFALRLAQVRALGHNAALVSLPWAKIEPESERFDTAVMDRCAGMLEALRAAGIEPLCILWDGVEPPWFEDRGGWAHPKAAKHFQAYTARIAEILTPHCRYWVPLAEPEYWLARTYHESRRPGYRRALAELLRAQDDSTTALRAVRPDAKVGLSVRVFSAEPADIDSPWDFRAAQRLEHRLNHRMAERLRETSGRDAFDFALASWGGVVSAWFSPWQWRREWVLTLDKQRKPISLKDADRDLARFDEAMSALLGYQTPLLVTGEGQQPSVLRDQLNALALRCAEEGGDRVMGFLLRAPVDSAEWESNADLLETMRSPVESWPLDVDKKEWTA